ncbi:phage tail protein [Microbacterium dextranolyticum]|uniref:Tape measure protein n=1 Tax=Microbacterium dextranolyticum TaxID=36806 RepID=A0A9W6M6K8_9MICO|nr:phage tail length tape measure family protein [Microbacterium dextranolyticum]MBM7462908.1 phage-related protein [Microbacterium dextranolyticum]GLJ95986.1 hypothetical protein GCM10017591_20490 [Microbacterium dextranolyticum]
MAGQTIAISVLADTKQLKSGLDDAAGGLGAFGKGLAGIGVAVGAMAVGAGVAIGALGVEAFKAVAEVERLNAQTSAALTSTGGAAERSIDQITGLADSLERMSGVEAETIQAGQNMLLTFTNIKGTNFDAATKSALDMSVAMGTDMTSAATLVGKALNDPIKGVGALSKVGVQLTADQKAMVEQMTAVGDVAGAQGIILGVLQEQFGGSAEAFGGTFLGTVEKVKNSFGALTEMFVTDLLPPITNGLNKVNDLFVSLADSPTFQAIAGGIGEAFASLLSGDGFDISGIADTLLDARGAIVDAALRALSGILDAAGEILPRVVESTATLITTVVTFLANNAPMLLGAALTALTGIVQAVVQVVPPLIASLATLLPDIVQTLSNFTPGILAAAVQVLTSIIEAVPVIIPPLVDALVGLLPTLLGAILSLLPRLAEAALSLFMSLVEAIPQIIPPLVQGIVTLLPRLVSSVVGMLPRLITAAVELFTGIVTAIPQIIPQLVDALITLAPVMIDALARLVPALIKAGIDLIAGLVKGLWNAAGSVGSALIEIAKSAIGGFLSLLGIHSPSRLFAGYGGNVIDGLVKGLRGGEGDLTRQMGRIANTTSGAFDASLSAAPFGSLGAQRVRSDYRIGAPTRTVSAPESSVVQLSQYDRSLLTEIADRVGLTIGSQTLQATVSGANNAAVSRRAG